MASGPFSIPCATEEIVAHIKRGTPVEVTVTPRKLRVAILKLDSDGAYATKIWKKSVCYFPPRLIIYTQKFETEWIMEMIVRDHNIPYFRIAHVGFDTMIWSSWTSQPTMAMGEIYEKVKGAKMHPGFSASGLFGFKLPVVQSIIYGVCNLRDIPDSLRVDRLVHGMVFKNERLEALGLMKQTRDDLLPRIREGAISPPEFIATRPVRTIYGCRPTLVRYQTTIHIQATSPIPKEREREEQTIEPPGTKKMRAEEEVAKML